MDTTEKAEKDYFKALLDHLRRAGIKDGSMTISDALRQLKAKGDKIAAHYLAELESPKNRVYWALSTAAAKRHPKWEVCEDGRGIRRIDDEDGDPDALVEWFQVNYPRDAKRIEAETLAD